MKTELKTENILEISDKNSKKSNIYSNLSNEEEPTEIILTSLFPFSSSFKNNLNSSQSLKKENFFQKLSQPLKQKISFKKILNDSNEMINKMTEDQKKEI